MKKTTPYKLILAIIVIGLITISCGQDKKTLTKIYNNPGYAIGQITSTVKVVFYMKYNFQYSIDDVNFKNSRNGFSITNYTDYRSSITGNKYIVVYDKAEPKLSDLNFNYMINDSTDFLNYLEDFKTNPPKP